LKEPPTPFIASNMVLSEPYGQTNSISATAGYSQSTVLPGLAAICARQSTRIAFVGRQFLAFADMHMAPSFLRFAAIQGIERKYDLTDLAPKGCFISAEAVEGEIGQIGKTQKAPREFSGRIDGRVDRRRFRA
jgi:hypothetical protein